MIHLMSYQDLIDTLTYLKENRKLGSEADALVFPFLETICPLQLRFDSQSRTFVNPYDASFDGGQTVVGEIIGENLEFSLLLPLSDSEWTESLEKGEEFEGTAKFLGFDGLYQRGIFGYQGKIQVEEEEETNTDTPLEETDEPFVEEDSVEDGEGFLEEPIFSSSTEKPEGERENFSVEQQVVNKEEVSEVEEEIQEPDQEVSTDEVYQSDPDTEEVEALSADFEKQDSGSKPKADDQANSIVKRQDTTVDHSTDEKELSLEEIRRVMDRAKTWGVNGLSKKEQGIYRSEIARTKIDRSELMRILDKKYAQGTEFFTEEERRVYDQEQAKRTKRNRGKKETKPEKPGQFRLFLSVIFLFCIVVSFGNEAVSLSFFFSLLIIYFLHPWVSFWLGSDPCTNLFRTRLLREPKFRRGVGLFLLSLCLLSSSPVLGLFLFFVSLIVMVPTKTFDYFIKKIQK